MIRHARPVDRPAIAALIRAAFERPDEARLVERLRADEDILFELVAEADGELVGHILFSRLWADRTALFASLAPVAVRPDRQGEGLGSKLVENGLETCREFGVHGVVVLGDPAYYTRFGFSAEAASRVTSPFSGSPAFMALALEEGAFAEPMLIAYPEAFEAG